MSVVFFTDRDLGNRFPDIFVAAGLTVERHRDHFRPDCPDEEWLQTVGANGWVAITHDARIRYKPNERDAVIRHRVKLLVVVGKVPLADLAANFVSTMPKVEPFLAAHRAPLIAKVYRPPQPKSGHPSSTAGDIVLWYPPS